MFHSSILRASSCLKTSVLLFFRCRTAVHLIVILEVFWCSERLPDTPRTFALGYFLHAMFLLLCYCKHFGKAATAICILSTYTRGGDIAAEHHDKVCMMRLACRRRRLELARREQENRERQRQQENEKWWRYGMAESLWCRFTCGRRLCVS